MSIKEKAVAFLEYKNRGDVRAKVLLAVLSQAYGISPNEALTKIEELAAD